MLPEAKHLCPAEKCRSDYDGGQLRRRWKYFDRWRTQPTAFDVAVRVYGNSPGSSPFYKDALLLFGSDDGGLLLLNVPVCDGQMLLITNMATMEDQACRVTHTNERGNGKIEVGFEFPSPTVDFWKITGGSAVKP